MRSPSVSAPVLKAPFPYFGGKSRVGPIVWERFGNVRNYVEPFAGSLAMLLARPEPFHGTETVNDFDGFISNFWRAIKAEPEAVAVHADNPINENDLHARHAWLNGQRDPMVAKLEGNPNWYDAKIAGWWCWGLCCWIGSGWCSGKGPWNVVNGELVNVKGTAGEGVNRQRLDLADAGRGVNRQLVYLGAGTPTTGGRGIHGKGMNCALLEWFGLLSQRLRKVRVCSGDWSRVCTNAVTTRQGLTSVFLDPPYADTAKRSTDLYTMDSLSVAHEVRAWAIEHGTDPKLRICLAGYEGEHAMPDTWAKIAWKTAGGYASQS